LQSALQQPGVARPGQRPACAPLAHIRCADVAPWRLSAPNPRRIIAQGEKLPDPEQCFKEQTFNMCYNQRTRLYTTYAGLAGGSGGLLLLCAVLFRYG
jgi:hypothetical protein